MRIKADKETNVLIISNAQNEAHIISRKEEQTMKKLTKIIMVAGIFIPMTACSTESSGSNKTNNEFGELSSMSVKVNDDVITMYEPLKNILDDGNWVLYEDDEKEDLESLDDRNVTLVSKDDEDIMMRVNVINWGDQDTKVEDATLTRIRIDDSMDMEITYELPKNLKPGSSLKDTIKAYGSPAGLDTFTYKGEDEISISYVSSPKYDKCNELTMHFKEDKLTAFEMSTADKAKKRNKDISFDLEKVYGYKPLFDLNKTKKSNNTEIEKGVIQINDKPITTDTKVGELFDDGWNLENSYDDDNGATIFLQKENTRIILESDGKYSDGMEALRTASIFEISIENDSETVYTLPGGVKSTDTLKTFTDVYGMPFDFSYNEDGVHVVFGNREGCNLNGYFDKNGELTDLSYVLKYVEPVSSID